MLKYLMVDGFAIGVALEIGGLEISSTSPFGERGVITKSIASSPVTNEGESFGAGGTFFSGRLLADDLPCDSGGAVKAGVLRGR